MPVVFLSCYHSPVAHRYFKQPLGLVPLLLTAVFWIGWLEDIQLKDFLIIKAKSHPQEKKISCPSTLQTCQHKSDHVTSNANFKTICDSLLNWWIETWILSSTSNPLLIWPLLMLPPLAAWVSVVLALCHLLESVRSLSLLCFQLWPLTSSDFYQSTPILPWNCSSVITASGKYFLISCQGQCHHVYFFS